MCADVKPLFNITEEFKELTYEDNTRFNMRALKTIYFLSSIAITFSHSMESYRKFSLDN
jgi:hypothetical protein